MFLVAPGGTCQGCRNRGGRELLPGVRPARHSVAPTVEPTTYCPICRHSALRQVL